MKAPFRSVLLVLALGCAVGFPIRAAADDRLAGYWISAPGEVVPTAFSFGILGKWTLVSEQWDASGPGPKVRYTVVTTGTAGTLTADEKLDRLPDVPRTISYEITGGELFLTIPETTHVGKYHLLKGVPPAAAKAAPPPSAAPNGPTTPPPNKPRPAPGPAHDPNGVLGSWTTEPGANVQVSLFIVIASPTSVKVTQLWIKGSENPVTSRAGEYAVTFAAGGSRGTMAKNKVDSEGPEIPLRMDYSLEGDGLVITVDDGPFIGQYRLVRKQK
jgi:hypothetical protein